MKIAVIGSGISGLAATWYLSKQHQVTLCERGPKIGMDAHSIEVDCGQGSVYLNAPMRVFFEGYYPTLNQLYDDIAVAYEPIKYSGSFSHHGGNTYFRYKNHWLGSLTVPFLAGRSIFNPQALKIGAELIRFLRQARSFKHETAEDSLTIEQYLKQNGYSERFCNGFLYPAFAGICTCSYERVKTYPASIILGYLSSDLTWSRVNRLSHGVHDVAQRLSSAASRIHCNLNLEAVSHQGNTVEITDGNGYTEHYDHVVVATQANQAMKLLANGSAEEKSALSKFHYEKSRLVVHKDRRLAPRKRSEWAPVNFLLSDTHDKPMASIWMNQIYPQLGSKINIFETWNPFHDIDPDKVLIDAEVERPVVSQDSLQSIRQLDTLHAEQGRHIWFCGSYSSRGIPLLESAVASAKAVAHRLNTLPTVGTEELAAPIPAAVGC